MDTGTKKAFAKWLEKAYLTWQAEKGKRTSLQEFADYIGYSRPLISLWMAGQRLPTNDGIKKLAELFGPEVYDALKLPRPDPMLQRLTKNWSDIPEKIRKNLLEQVDQYVKGHQNGEK
jgi:transcriptional regulator with XRE-family HTH domain